MKITIQVGRMLHQMGGFPPVIEHEIEMGITLGEALEQLNLRPGRMVRKMNDAVFSAVNKCVFIGYETGITGIRNMIQGGCRGGNGSGFTGDGWDNPEM